MCKLGGGHSARSAANVAVALVVILIAIKVATLVVPFFLGSIIMLNYDLTEYFPIQSQTSSSDKLFLLAAIEMVTAHKKRYSYVEVGSFLGGSLTPFLKDSNCYHVLSIDERERKQPDERGANFDYAGVTHKTMIDNLNSVGIGTEKLQTYDGSVDTVGPTAQSFDLAFIDGEHTDYACVRDFLWILPMLKPDSLIMFHDSSLVFKGIRIIQLYLRKIGIPFQFFKKNDSEMSGIFLGSFAGVDVAAIFGRGDNPEEFYSLAETSLIQQLVANRVEVKFSYQINPAKTISAF